ncbi:MAG TPA: DUF4831 family protein [Bacteroidales bacterium]|jgi:hypothetical protein|nr:DUF4831 family protein [Bacteroidales bacterium]HOS58277.1 DUF4831 family protein [Bacteroidales bacterium]HRT13936.1 DUF4831 family protein [Bacteroidales bacterium]
MKKITLLITSIIFILFSYGQNSVIEVSSLTQPLPKTNGFFYLLPKTAFKIEVTVTRTNFIKGYYTEYAEKLLGLNNVISTNETSYSLNKISIHSFSIPDTQYLYYVELSPKQEKNQFLTQFYQNYNFTNTVFDSSYSNISTQLPDFFKNYSDLTYVEKEDYYVETQIIDGVVTEIPVSKTKKVTKTVEEKAHEAADFIIQIRKDKYDLTAGAQEVPYSKEALEFLTSELNKWEKNYLDLFTGISIEDELTYSIIVIPENELDTLIPLFSLDAAKGYSTTKSTTSANNYYLKISPMISHAKWEQFMTAKASEEKYIPNNGYRIRKPCSAEVSLWYNQKPIQYCGMYQLYQLGKIETLPAKNDDFNIAKFVLIY